MNNIYQNYYEKMLDYLMCPQGKIKVSTTFHSQVAQIKKLLRNDTTSLISTILDFMIHGATVPYSFDAQNEKLNKIIRYWENNVNHDLNIDIPKGLRSFEEQYMRERLTSSLICVRMKWNKVNDVLLPTRMWVMDGGSIYVENEKNSLNTNKYYFGKPDEKKSNILVNTETETILVRKPYNQWYDTYPTPYLVRKGALYHALFKQQTLDRIADVINTAFPYQFLIKVGTEQAINNGNAPSEEILRDLVDQFQNQKQKSLTHPFSKGLAGAYPADVKFEELMPSYNKVLDEKIFQPIDKNILSALGMIELKGFSQTREEMILNPKVLVEEVTDMVADYTDFMQDVMDLIKEKNKSKYTMNDSIDVSPGIIESFLTDSMRTLIRSLYDRGLVSMEDTLEDTTPLKFKTQVKKRKTETKDKLNITMYPRIVQNMEQHPDDLTPQNEDVPDDKKKGTPEADNYNNACDEEDLILEPMKTIKTIPNDIAKTLSSKEKQIFKKAFNEGLETAKKLDYDPFLTEKTAMEFAISQVLKNKK